MKITFVGCSYTHGVGLSLEKNDSDLYANIVAKHFFADIVNLSKPGNSNENIFMSALNNILFGDSDIIFVQWTGLNRVWVYPGPSIELLLTNSNHNTDDFQYKNIFYTKKELKYVADTWKLLNHDYQHLINLINYCKILLEIAGKKNMQIFFINGLVPWTEEILTLNSITDFSKELSPYTKEILDFDSRPDDELNKLFANLHKHLLESDTSRWINQFNSMHKKLIDRGTDNSHPGIQSHRLYAKMIVQYLQTQHA